jgi:hypothetical protein
VPRWHSSATAVIAARRPGRRLGRLPPEQADAARTAQDLPGLPAGAILAMLCAISAATVVVLGSRLTFFNDDWYILLLRPDFGAESLLEPHNGHLTLLPILAYKGLVAAFGLDAQVPFRLLLAGVTVATGVAAFVYVRGRLGEVPALLGAAVLLFLGPAWQDLLWSFQIGLVGSLATGVFALISLEHASRRGDLVACTLLVGSVCLSNLGVSFVIAAAVMLALHRRLAAAWVVAVPGVIFAGWWLVWGQEDNTGFSWQNVARSPFYVFDAIAAGLASVSGLGNVREGFDPFAWGRPLLALALLGGAALVLRGWRPPVAALPIAFAAFSFWALLAFNFVGYRTPEESRYQLVSATFILLIAAELARGLRPRGWTLAAAAVVALLSIGSNLAAYTDGYRFFRDEASVTKADLAALDIGRGHIDRKFRLLQQIAGSVYMTGVYAGPYYRERDEHGSPAYSPAELAAATARARSAADGVLASGYALRLEPASGGVSGRGGCIDLEPGVAAGTREMTLAPGGAVLANGAAPGTLRLRRFGDEAAVELGMLAPGQTAVLRIPVDAVARRWRLAASGGSPVYVCPLPTPLGTRAGS